VILGSWATREMLGLPPKAEVEAGDTLRMCLVVGMLAAASMIYFYWSREKLAFLQRQAALDALQREEAEKQLVRAQLMALQAQIEPHFLFNSLANLDGLIATDPAAARVLLRRLIGFLRMSLAHTRAEQCTLRQEFELLRSYLDIQAMRFGERLAYEIDLPAALAEVEIPPMLVQPLVENAVTHGIEPCTRGGRIVLSARAAGDDAVQVLISDTGVGFGHGAGGGSGMGLTHVRERLARIFGAAALMQIEENTPRGVVVRLTLPVVRRASPAAAAARRDVAPSVAPAMQRS
jgi:sensor histidine kinase YesM